MDATPGWNSTFHPISSPGSLLVLTGPMSLSLPTPISTTRELVGRWVFVIKTAEEHNGLPACLPAPAAARDAQFLAACIQIERETGQQPTRKTTTTTKRTNEQTTPNKSLNQQLSLRVTVCKHLHMCKCSACIPYLRQTYHPPIPLEIHVLLLSTTMPCHAMPYHALTQSHPCPPPSHSLPFVKAASPPSKQPLQTTTAAQAS